MMKKVPAARRTARMEKEVSVRTQSAAERSLAEAQVRLLIAEYAPSHLRSIGAVRRSLRKRLPTAHELAYEYRDFFLISYSPNEHGYEGVLAIHSSANGVALYFNQGNELSDPEKLLQGSGKQVRWIQLEGAKSLAHPQIANLIEEAIDQSSVPFAGSGLGSITIRPTAARQRRISAEPKTPTKKTATKKTRNNDGKLA